MSIRQTAYRTHTCGELREDHDGQEVRLAGTLRTRLDDRVFLLADQEGRTLVTLAPGATGGAELGATHEGAILRVDGAVTKRMKADPANPTGAVYLIASAVEVIGAAEAFPPMLLEHEPDRAERMRFRQLDLGGDAMQANLRARAAIVKRVRAHLKDQDVLEVETPLLTGWSEADTGSFFTPATRTRVYGLAGTTQRAKQLLIAGGIERYYQFARCFRREDWLSPERQLEYTILDLEFAYVTEEDLFDRVEALLAEAFAAVGKELPRPFPRLTYHQALLKYGTDRPDLRADIEIHEVKALAPKDGLLATTGLQDGGAARAFRVPGAAKTIRNDLLETVCVARLDETPIEACWSRVNDGGEAKGRHAPEFPAAVLEKLGAQPGDLLVAVASESSATAAAVAGRARVALARAAGLIDESTFAPAWITRFPFFARNLLTGNWQPLRQPFTQPIEAHVEWLADPKKRHRVLTKGFDLVLDGEEMGAGGVRNHDVEVQRQVLRAFGDPADEITERFGAMLDTFAHGIPPHGGIAIGFDRLLARIFGGGDLANVTAFPKNGAGEDPLLKTPVRTDADLARAILS